MITPEEFIRRWETPDRVQYDPDVVNRLNLPEVSKRFLIQAGLPKITFDLGANTLVPLPDAALSNRWAYGIRKHFPTNYSRYRLLGIRALRSPSDNFDTLYFCLDEQQDGKVVWVRNEPGYPVELLNNTVPQLAEMLLLMRDDSRNRQTLDWNNSAAIEHYFEDLERRLRNIDTEALQEDKGWSEMIYRLRG